MDIPAPPMYSQPDNLRFHTYSHDEHSNVSGEFQRLPSSSRFF
jgi:hypothetical protein